MIDSSTCLGLHIECGTLFKGAGVTVVALILFVGSVYLMLSFVFGKWMGYLILAVCFAGWLMIHSSLWYFGFWAQGPGTPTNQGPRGAEPAWVVVEAGLSASNELYTTFDDYPSSPWQTPTKSQEGSVETATSAATSFLAEQANEELDREEFASDAVLATQFSVDSVRFATAEDDKTPLAVVQAHYSGGGPLTTLSLYHDSGSVPRYSIMFMIGSTLLFLLHLPLLDRAEKKRKEFLLGGSAPAWFGPA